MRSEVFKPADQNRQQDFKNRLQELQGRLAELQPKNHDVLSQPIGDFLEVQGIISDPVYLQNSVDEFNFSSTPRRFNRLEKRATDVMRFLQEKYGAQTVGEAVALVKERKVDPKEVQAWIDSDTSFDSFSLLRGALMSGYPELTEALEQSAGRIMQARENSTDVEIYRPTFRYGWREQ